MDLLLHMKNTETAFGTELKTFLKKKGDLQLLKNKWRAKHIMLTQHCSLRAFKGSGGGCENK